MSNNEYRVARERVAQLVKEKKEVRMAVQWCGGMDVLFHQNCQGMFFVDFANYIQQPIEKNLLQPIPQVTVAKMWEIVDKYIKHKHGGTIECDQSGVYRVTGLDGQYGKSFGLSGSRGDTAGLPVFVSNRYHMVQATEQVTIAVLTCYLWDLILQPKLHEQYVMKHGDDHDKLELTAGRGY